MTEVRKVLRGMTAWWRQLANESTPGVSHVPVCYYFQQNTTSVAAFDQLLAAVVCDTPNHDRDTTEVVFIRECSVTGPWMALQVFMPIDVFKELDAKTYIGFVYEVIRHGERQD